MKQERILTDRETCLIAAMATCGIKLNPHMACMVLSMVDEIDSKGVNMTVDDIKRIKYDVDTLFINERNVGSNDN